jgi:hypothetical protein
MYSAQRVVPARLRPVRDEVVCTPITTSSPRAGVGRAVELGVRARDTNRARRRRSARAAGPVLRRPAQ